jgi:hypothetical protein
MNKSTSDAISQDNCIIKERILHFTKLAAEIEEFDPPISIDDKKSNIRGWNHPQIGWMLCTPVKLSEFDKDPKA